MHPALTIQLISDTLRGNAFWLEPLSEASHVVNEAARRGYVRRLSHTQAQWTEEGLARARIELAPRPAGEAQDPALFAVVLVGDFAACLTDEGCPIPDMTARATLAGLVAAHLWPRVPAHLLGLEREGDDHFAWWAPPCREVAGYYLDGTVFFLRGDRKGWDILHAHCVTPAMTANLPEVERQRIEAHGRWWTER